MTLKDGHVEFAGWIIHLQAGIRPDPRGYDALDARYGTTTYGSSNSNVNWQTIDCQLLRVTAGHGGSLDQIPGMRARLGRLTASLYDPERILDPAASPFVLLTQVGVPIRLIAVRPGTGEEVPLWTGRAETWEHDLLTGEGSLVASDNVALISGVDVADWYCPTQNAKARLQAVISAMPEPMFLKFSGNARQLSWAKFSGSLWGAVVSTGEAEQSIVWVDQFGWLRRSEVTGFGTTIKCRDCDDGTSPIIYTQLTSAMDDEIMTNIVYADRLNLDDAHKERDPLQFGSTTSASKNGPHSLTKTNLPLVDDAALKEWANRVLGLRATALKSITGMSITLVDPGDFDDPAAFAWVPRSMPYITAMEVGMVLDVRLTSRGQPNAWVTAIAGINHTIVPDSWEVQLEVVDGAAITSNRGYDDPTSLYDVTTYSRPDGAMPSVSDIVARILASQEASV